MHNHNKPNGTTREIAGNQSEIQMPVAEDSENHASSSEADATALHEKDTQSEKASDQRDLRQLGQRISQLALENAKIQIHSLVDIEGDFQNFVKQRQENGLRFMREQNFLPWEEEFRATWKRYTQELNVYGVPDSGQTLDAAEISGPITRNNSAENTVEACAGQFYSDRSKALLKAIEASDDPEKETDRSLIETFFHSYAKHLEKRFTITKGWSFYNINNLNTQRGIAHDNLINHLNKLNALAEKYKTQRFTPRDFWTGYDYKKEDAKLQRILWDRGCVEEYARAAFPDEYERRYKEYMEEVRWS